MLQVGITGGIGSGKSLVAKVLETLGVPVYYADVRAKELMQENDALKKGIIATFGEAAYTGGQLNRPYLAQQVFNDAEKLHQLNGLVHPAVWTDISAWFASHLDQPYAAEESAILYETGAAHGLDKVILVYAPEEARIARTMARDKVSREDVLARIRNQIDQELARSQADFVVVNDGREAIIPQVLHIHKTLLELSRKH